MLDFAQLGNLQSLTGLVPSKGHLEVQIIIRTDSGGLEDPEGDGMATQGPQSVASEPPLLRDLGFLTWEFQ